MIDHEKISYRVDLVASNCPPPRSAYHDEVCASLHGVGVGLLDAGGARIFDNAYAVLKGVIAKWPEELRPNESDIVKEAIWVTKQDFNELINPKSTASPLRDRIEAAIAGKLVAVPWPWPSLGPLTRSLMPGAITFIVGSAGTSKSFLLHQAALFWIEKGWRVALYAIEEDAGFWLHRGLALIAGIGAITDPAWLAAHPTEARALYVTHDQKIKDLQASLTCTPPTGITLAGLAEWIEKQCAAGMRIIAVDPISACSTKGADPWTAAEDFMMRAKRAVTASGASLIITTHGRKGDSRGGKTTPDLDSIAGGAAYARFASCAIWLEALAESESVSVLNADGIEHAASINRRLRILKAREGRGTGLVLGMNFNGETLHLAESGMIIKNESQERRISANVNASRAPNEIANRARKNAAPPSKAEDLYA